MTPIILAGLGIIGTSLWSGGMIARDGEPLRLGLAIAGPVGLVLCAAAVVWSVAA